MGGERITKNIVKTSCVSDCIGQACNCIRIVTVPAPTTAPKEEEVQEREREGEMRLRCLKLLACVCFKIMLSIKLCGTYTGSINRKHLSMSHAFKCLNYILKLAYQR